MANRFPFVGSGRAQEGGALATRKQDFNAHWEGNGFRHDATDIDMNPIISSLNGTTVQQTLERIHSLIVSSGTGFLSIGKADGYSQGSYNVGDTNTPTLYDAFNAAFSDIRLTNGGVILLLAGTYSLKKTITIPAGICIMGELSGTTIVGDMQESPMFIVSKANTQVQIVSGINLDTGSNVGCVRLMNLSLFDNIDGYTSGEPSMTTVPMIQAEISSVLHCENVSFVGKIHTGTTPRTKTQSAVGYIGSGTNGTVLNIKNCYLDGLRIGISFTPGNNEKDFLVVDKCKARIYGTEDAAAQGIYINSFIVASHCNATITNNYFLGAGDYVNTLFNTISGDGSNTRSIISGNSGSPNSLINGKIFVESSGSPSVSVIANNNWGNTIDSSWYIVVGSGNGSSPVGDFNGPKAIDTILNIANTITSFQTTVIVNPGNYTINGTSGGFLGIFGNFANLRFIGNKHGKNYPIFTLAISLSTLDSLGNKPLTLGNHLESIQFVSSGTRHSIRPSFSPLTVSLQSSAHTMKVIDCIFINTSLYALDLSTKPWTDSSGNIATTNIEISDCYFLQNGNFIDTTSMLLPNANTVKVENCFFTGNGYAFNIGNTGYNPSHSSSNSNVSLSNIICDLTGYSISGYTNSLEKSYVLVDSSMFLNIENCQFYANNQFGSSSVIDVSLTSAGVFNKFIYLKASNINIDDSTFVGPNQTFTVTGVGYALPTLFLEPLSSMRIRNSKFIGGTLPIQLSGNALSDLSLRESAIIENCYLNSPSQVLIDFDLSLSNGGPTPQIIIKGCNLTNGSNNVRVFHTNTTDTIRTGAVQLYVGDSLVSFINNIAKISLSTIGSFLQYGVLMVNSFENSGTNGDQINSVIVSGNSIYATNNISVSNVNVSSGCLLIRSSSIQIQDNLLAMYNNVAVSTCFVGSLIIDNVESSSNGHSDAIVTGNIFSRKNILGAFSTLARGYIQLSSTSSQNNGGLISNNVFDSTTYNNSSTSLVEDNTATLSNNINSSHWVITHNKNQTGNQLVNWAAGVRGIATGSDANKVILYGGNTSTSSIYSTSTVTDTVSFNYIHTGSLDQFNWYICLSEILPPNVTVTGFGYSFQATSVPGTTKLITVSLIGQDGIVTDSNTIAGTSTVNKTVSTGLNFTTKPTDNIYIRVEADINHSSTLRVDMFNFVINYIW